MNKIETKQRIWYLSTTSQADRECWIKAIQLHIPGDHVLVEQKQQNPATAPNVSVTNAPLSTPPPPTTTTAASTSSTSLTLRSSKTVPTIDSNIRTNDEQIQPSTSNEKRMQEDSGSFFHFSAE
jgi:hypothetical protein